MRFKKFSRIARVYLIRDIKAILLYIISRVPCSTLAISANEDFGGCVTIRGYSGGTREKSIDHIVAKDRGLSPPQSRSDR